ncbi:putative cuticular protein [Ixodes scapularis]
MWDKQRRVPVQRLLIVATLVRAVVAESANSILHREQDDYGNYEFGFNIEGLAWDQFQRESGDALGRKMGAYGFRGADGRLRLVEYVADELGFRAKVQTNEPGTKPSRTATVMVDTAAPGSVHEASAKTAIHSPPPTRLLRRLSPAPPLLPVGHAKVPEASEPLVKDVAPPKAATEHAELKVPPVKSVAANFESPLLPIGAVKMDSHAALRHYSPNIFHLGRPVNLVHGIQQHPRVPVGPYRPRGVLRDGDTTRGAALVPKEVNGRIVQQVALIKADGTLSTGGLNTPVQYDEQRSAGPSHVPQRRIPLQVPPFQNPNIGNIFPINTVHPASLGFQFQQQPFPISYATVPYQAGYEAQSPGPAAVLVPQISDFQRLPDGLAANYFLPNPPPAAPEIDRPPVQPHIAPQVPTQRGRFVDPAQGYPVQGRGYQPPPFSHLFPYQHQQPPPLPPQQPHHNLHQHSHPQQHLYQQPFQHPHIIERQHPHHHAAQQRGQYEQAVHGSSAPDSRSVPVAGPIYNYPTAGHQQLLQQPNYAPVQLYSPHRRGSP